MILVRSDAEIRLEEGLTEILVDTDRDVELSLENHSENAQVFIRLKRLESFILGHLTTLTVRLVIWFGIV